MEGMRSRSGPKLTWEQARRANMIVCEIDGMLAQDKRALKAAIRRPDLATGGNYRRN